MGNSSASAHKLPITPIVAVLRAEIGRRSINGRPCRMNSSFGVKLFGTWRRVTATIG